LETREGHGESAAHHDAILGLRREVHEGAEAGRRSALNTPGRGPYTLTRGSGPSPLVIKAEPVRPWRAISGMIEGGTDGTFSFTFEEPGTYDYFCIPHEDLGMVGTVTVTVTGGTATASPTATGTATATASPTATALSDTGGPPVSSLLITLGATLTLVVSGVIALALLRRRGAS
jgi:hypothetical protein